MTFCLKPIGPSISGKEKLKEALQKSVLAPFQSEAIFFSALWNGRKTSVLNTDAHLTL